MHDFEANRNTNKGALNAKISLNSVMGNHVHDQLSSMTVIIEEQTFLDFQLSSNLLFNILFLEVQLILSVSHKISHILTPIIEIVKEVV